MSEKDIGQQYGQALESTQESFARRGLTFSSERDKAEKLLADRAKSMLDAQQRATSRSLEDIGRTAAGTYGSRNLPSSFSLTTGASPITGVPGVYGITPSTGTRSIALPTDIVGSQERQRLYDERARVNELTANERQLRGLTTQ